MKLLAIICFALLAAGVHTFKIEYMPQAHKDASQLLELPKNAQNQKIAYKEVILYLTPSEIKALKENNVLQVSNNELYSRHLENIHTSHLRKPQQPETIKPVQELKEDTPEAANHKLINIPLYYPFDLIPLNNNAKKLENQDKKWTEEIKKHLEQSLRENLETRNTWTPIADKHKTSQIKTLPKVNQPELTSDNLLQFHHNLNNYNTRNILGVQDYYRLQYELEQLNKNNNYGEALAKAAQISLKDDIIVTENHQTLKKIPSAHPTFLYQNQQSVIKGYPSTLLHAITPTLRPESALNPIEFEKHNEHYKTKSIFGNVHKQL